MDWQQTAAKLAEEFPGALLGSGERPGDTPRIAIPFDRQVPMLLKPLERAGLDYNPLGLDDLVPALGERLGACYQARERAQQLQQDGFREVSDVVQRRAFIAEAKTQLKWSRDNEAGFLRNQTRLSFGSGTVQGPSMTKDEVENATKMWATLYDSQSVQLKALEDENEARRLRLEEAVGAGNYAHRFEQLFRLFAIDLVEACQMARAVRVGMREVYQAGLSALPNFDSLTFLDDLIAWFKACQTTYRLALEQSRYVTVLLPFAKTSKQLGMMDPDTFAKRVDSLSIEFDPRTVAAFLAEQHGVSAHARLRAIDFWSSDVAPDNPPGPLALKKVIQCRVVPPEQAAAIAPFNQRLSFTAAPIRDVTHLDDDIFVPQHLVNCAPMGTWTLKLEPETITGEAVTKDKLTNLYARIKLLIPAEIDPATARLKVRD